jgi:hypothetical protein
VVPLWDTYGPLRHLLKMNNLAVGIPLKSATAEDICREVDRALLLNPRQILVSINEGRSLAPARKAEALLNGKMGRVHLQIRAQPRNLGLYGNFFWLAQRAQALAFMWLCDDDEPTPDQGTLIHALVTNPSLNLIVPPQELWSWARGTGYTSFLGQVPTPSSRDIPAQKPDPSWIFGTWRTEALTSMAPRRPFDWLDFYLLFNLLAHGKIGSVDAGPARIGVKEGSRPHSVGALFNPLPFTLLALRSSWRREFPAQYGRSLRESTYGFWRHALSLNADMLRSLWRNS